MMIFDHLVQVHPKPCLVLSCGLVFVAWISTCLSFWSVGRPLRRRSPSVLYPALDSGADLSDILMNATVISCPITAPLMRGMLAWSYSACVFLILLTASRGSFRVILFIATLYSQTSTGPLSSSSASVSSSPSNRTSPSHFHSCICSYTRLLASSSAIHIITSKHFLSCSSSNLSILFLSTSLAFTLLNNSL